MTKAQCELVYFTAPDRRRALLLARHLVTRRLAACVNLLGSVTSFYRWKGKREEGREIALLAKTRRSLVPALTEAIQALHPYEVPCVVAMPITGGNPVFLDWIRNATLDARGLQSLRRPPSMPERRRK